jgi:hypothetical protein
MSYESINHPKHYNVGIETTEYINSWGMSFVEGNIIKYVSRYRYKKGLEDLLKAQWYLSYLIKKVEAESVGKIAESELDD